MCHLHGLTAVVNDNDVAFVAAECRRQEEAVAWCAHGIVFIRAQANKYHKTSIMNTTDAVERQTRVLGSSEGIRERHELCETMRCFHATSAQRIEQSYTCEKHSDSANTGAADHPTAARCIR
jgi:hypothetical protein